mmetsp:Transcript_8779/g.25539  ORF Transcript_8779/g.25539 Transcript_8779/m.25539 type:complete len:206 (-) Transcript_8779:42-659(-)
MPSRPRLSSSGHSGRRVKHRLYTKHHMLQQHRCRCPRTPITPRVRVPGLAGAKSRPWTCMPCLDGCRRPDREAGRSTLCMVICPGILQSPLWRRERRACPSCTMTPSTWTLCGACSRRKRSGASWVPRQRTRSRRKAHTAMNARRGTAQRGRKSKPSSFTAPYFSSCITLRNEVIIGSALLTSVPHHRLPRPRARPEAAAGGSTQ